MPATIIISLILAAIVFFIVKKMVKDKKQGKSSCGCNCSSCPMGGCCCGSVSNVKRTEEKK